MTAPPTVELLPTRLRLAVVRLARRLRHESGVEITASQLSALSSVEHTGPVSLKDLAEIERVAPPSVTRIATCLEERGLVQRRPDAADRRVARLAITAAGRDLLAQSRARRDSYLAARLQALPEADRELLERAVPILERLIGDTGE